MDNDDGCEIAESSRRSTTSGAVHVLDRMHLQADPICHLRPDLIRGRGQGRRLRQTYWL
jgi:hypothetical protein